MDIYICNSQVDYRCFTAISSLIITKLSIYRISDFLLTFRGFHIGVNIMFSKEVEVISKEDCNNNLKISINELDQLIEKLDILIEKLEKVIV